MEPLFSFKSCYTETEYVRFNQFILRQNPNYWISFVVMTVGGVWLLMVAKQWGVPMMLGLLMLAVALIIVYGLTLGAKKKARDYYAKDKHLNGLEFELKFYDDHFMQEHSNGSDSVEYSKIYKIHITKTNIYIMQSPLLGYIVPLADCPSGFADFVTKLKRDYRI